MDSLANKLCYNIIPNVGMDTNKEERQCILGSFIGGIHQNEF
jgi:hypothetical protein